MTRIAPVLCAILLAGCQQPLMSTANQPAPAIDGVGTALETTEESLAEQLAALNPGSRCTVTLADSTWENTREVSGTVARAAQGVVVLSDAEESITGRSETGVPMFSKVPYYSRLFKNTGVGVVRQPLGTQTLSAKQIQAVQVDD